MGKCKFGNFRERNSQITLSFVDIAKSCPSREFLTPQICFLRLFSENKILAKISEGTVSEQMN